MTAFSSSNFLGIDLTPSHLTDMTVGNTHYDLRNKGDAERFVLDVMDGVLDGRGDERASHLGGVSINGSTVYAGGASYDLKKKEDFDRFMTDALDGKIDGFQGPPPCTPYAPTDGMDAGATPMGYSGEAVGGKDYWTDFAQTHSYEDIKNAIMNGSIPDDVLKDERFQLAFQDKKEAHQAKFAMLSGIMKAESDIANSILRNTFA